MGKLDDIRAELYKGESEFVDQLKGADKSSPELQAEALARLNLIYKYASLKGRGRFLDEMRLPGAVKERKIAYDKCMSDDQPEAECDALMEKLPLFRPLLDAWPKDNTGPLWWSSPLTHLIGTYDPEAPPASDLTDWRDEVDTPLGEGAVIVDDAVEDLGDLASDLGDSVGDALEPEPDSVSWWKVGAAVGATALTGALVYRIAKG